MKGVESIIWALTLEKENQIQSKASRKLGSNEDDTEINEMENQLNKIKSCLGFLIFNFLLF